MLRLLLVTMVAMVATEDDIEQRCKASHVKISSSQRKREKKSIRRKIECERERARACVRRPQPNNFSPAKSNECLFDHRRLRCRHRRNRRHTHTYISHWNDLLRTGIWNGITDENTCQPFRCSRLLFDFYSFHCSRLFSPFSVRFFVLPVCTTTISMPSLAFSVVLLIQVSQRRRKNVWCALWASTQPNQPTHARVETRICYRRYFSMVLRALVCAVCCLLLPCCVCTTQNFDMNHRVYVVRSVAYQHSVKQPQRTHILYNTHREPSYASACMVACIELVGVWVCVCVGGDGGGGGGGENVEMR